MAEDSGKIYVVDSDETLHALEQRPYVSEDLLQTLLERYPDLLAGEQMSPSEPRRWALVSREVGVPGEEGGGDRWSLDHLFLDQDGVPTLVEVKRSTDTRIRREVVGQMLDYAANAVVYWPVERVVVAFERTCEAEGVDAAERVAELTRTEGGWEDYWQAVKTNLQAGRVRMVFLADAVPPELRRIVEFLNGQMDPAEVVAVEVRQYVGGDLRTLVPRVVGQTSQAEQKKAMSRPEARPEARRWDEPSFLDALERDNGPAEREVAEALLAWARARGLRLWWGKGAHHGSFLPMLDRGGEKHFTFGAWSHHGTIEVQLQHMHPPVGTDARKRELLRRVAAVPGVELTHEDLSRRPSLKMSALADPGALASFLAAFDWWLGEVEAHHGAP